MKNTRRSKVESEDSCGHLGKIEGGLETANKVPDLDYTLLFTQNAAVVNVY
jgi:hypothetical protein